MLVDFMQYVFFFLPFSYIVLFLWFDRVDESISPTKNEQRVRLEYKILDNSVRQRENTLVTTGSIFVAGSVILLSQTPSSLTIGPTLVLGSWLVYSIWLFFFQLTSARLTNKTYARLRPLERVLEFEAHNYLARAPLGTVDVVKKLVKPK